MGGASGGSLLWRSWPMAVVVEAAGNGVRLARRGGFRRTVEGGIGVFGSILVSK